MTKDFDLTAATLGEQVVQSAEDYLAAAPYVSASRSRGERQAQICRACHSLDKGDLAAVGGPGAADRERHGRRYPTRDRGPDHRRGTDHRRPVGRRARCHQLRLGGTPRLRSRTAHPAAGTSSHRRPARARSAPGRSWPDRHPTAVPASPSAARRARAAPR